MLAYSEVCWVSLGLVGRPVPRVRLRTGEASVRGAIQRSASQQPRLLASERKAELITSEVSARWTGLRGLPAGHRQRPAGHGPGLFASAFATTSSRRSSSCPRSSFRSSCCAASSSRSLPDCARARGDLAGAADDLRVRRARARQRGRVARRRRVADVAVTIAAMLLSLALGGLTLRRRTA